MGLNKLINCDDDSYILDAAEAAGIDLPYSCRAGACSTCVGFVLGGFYICDDQSFLHSCSLDAGYILLCVTYPVSDMTILTNQEKDATDHDCSPPISTDNAKQK